MEWAFFAIFAIVAIAYIFMKRSGQITAEDAQTLLKNGALVVDVRTPPEFRSGHIRGAVNLPVDQIEITLPSRVKDKNQPILLHCQAGTRSAVAKRKLNAMGYNNAYNLGSYGRAARIVDLAKSDQ
jgi:phage shock protein E